MRAVIALAALAASSSGCALYNGVLGVCAGDTYAAQVNQSIPDDNEAGVNSMISLPLTGFPDGIGVKANIDHGFESDVRVRLAHNNIVVELEDMDDHGPFHEFDGTDVGGIWILNVADTVVADTGFWNDWEISICGE